MRVGIDLGTTYSLIGRWDNEKVSLFADRGNNRLLHTPSVIVTRTHGAFVGRQAMDVLASGGDGAVPFVDIKRHLATAEVFRDADGIEWRPEALSALLLRKLTQDAEAAGQAKVSGAVITVPAQFYDRQRRAVEQAAEIAGLPLLGLLEEPVAAAFHYGMSRESSDCEIVVYDWGGGTFDVAVVSVAASKRAIYVRAKSGLERHGGRDVDTLIKAMIREQYHTRHKRSLELSQREEYQLTRHVEHDIKTELVDGNSAVVRTHMTLRGSTLEVNILRSEFERRVAPLVERTIDKTLECVREAGLTAATVDRVLLVGGTAMLPMVRRRLAQEFGERDARGNARVRGDSQMTAVARGAALQANEQGAIVARDVTPHNLGVMVADGERGGRAETVIARGTALGTERSLTLRWGTGDRVCIHVVEFSTPEVRRTVDQYEVIRPPLVATGAPIEVRFRYEGTGRVVFDARDPIRGASIDHRRMSADAQGGAPADLVRTWRERVQALPINGAA